MMHDDVVIHKWGSTSYADWAYHALPFRILIDLLDSTKIVGMQAYTETLELARMHEVGWLTGWVHMQLRCPVLGWRKQGLLP